MKMNGERKPQLQAIKVAPEHEPVITALCQKYAGAFSKNLTPQVERSSEDKPSTAASSSKIPALPTRGQSRTSPIRERHADADRHRQGDGGSRARSAQ